MPISNVAIPFNNDVLLIVNLSLTSKLFSTSTISLEAPKTKFCPDPAPVTVVVILFSSITISSIYAEDQPRSAVPKEQRSLVVGDISSAK